MIKIMNEVWHLFLVYSTAEYCAPVWCRSAYTRLRQCLERRLAHSHWMLASHSNGPPICTLRHLVSWASPTGSDTLLGSPWIDLDPDHILYVLLSGFSDTRQVRLRSRRPFVPAARNLLDNFARLGIRASEWTNHKWKMEYCEMCFQAPCSRPVPGLLGWAYTEQLGLNSTACGLVLGDSIRPCTNVVWLLHRIASVAPLSKQQTMF